jgi:DNA-binding CsgD family transcriptional regulator
MITALRTAIWNEGFKPATGEHEVLLAVTALTETGPGAPSLDSALGIERRVSQYVEERYVVELLADGVEGIGYLLKDRVAEVDRFIDAVTRVASGGSALDPQVVTQMMGGHRQEPLAQLSPRERQVLELMAEGRTNRAITEELSVTERAVERHVTSIFGK